MEGREEGVSATKGERGKRGNVRDQAKRGEMRSKMNGIRRKGERGSTSDVRVERGREQRREWEWEWEQWRMKGDANEDETKGGRERKGQRHECRIRTDIALKDIWTTG